MKRLQELDDLNRAIVWVLCACPFTLGSLWASLVFLLFG